MVCRCFVLIGLVVVILYHKTLYVAVDERSNIGGGDGSAEDPTEINNKTTTSGTKSALSGLIIINSCLSLCV